MSPNNLKLAALLEGGQHSVSTNPAYLELGFGQGISLNMHAASNLGQYWGTDFTPSQVAVASDYAQHGAKNLHLFEASFEELLGQHDLPQFDIIALHGIWSWVPEDARNAIVQITNDHLKPGGLFFVSYNVRVGWAGVQPLRDLLVRHYKANSNGSVVDRVQRTLDFATKAVEGGAKYFSQNPIAQAQLQDMLKKDPVYLAHEFFNDSWNPMNFSDVCDELGHAKLDYLGSSTLLDGVNGIHLTREAQELINAISNPRISGDLRDAFVGQRFRRDIFIKGLRHHSPESRRRKILEQEFALVRPAEDLPESVKGSLGTATLDQALYGKILGAFSGTEKSAVAVQEILSSPACKGVTFDQLDQAIRVLAHLNMIAPANSEEIVRSVRPATERLNAKLCTEAEWDDRVKVLASPLIGTALAVDRFERLFINCISRSLGDPAIYIWSLLEAQGERLQKEGKILETEEANIAELRTKYESFLHKRLPELYRLGIVSKDGKIDLQHEGPVGS